MSRLSDALERARRPFERGRRLARLAPLFEMVDTLLCSPAAVTRGSVHVRDAINLKRVMIVVVVALVPSLLMALYNTGYQAHLVLAQGGTELPDWRSAVFAATGLPASPQSPIACIVRGALYFIPVLAVSFAAGGAVEVLFAVVRRHTVNEGFFVTGFLIPLTLPPTIPLWQVAAGTAFGVLIAKEVFGGTGMNFLNPALVVRAILFFAYPAQMSGDVWVAAKAPDGMSGATSLARLAEGDATAPDLWNAFLGLTQGSMGETSALACLLGAVVLLLTRVASARTLIGVVLGTLVTAELLRAIGSASNPMFDLPFHWHMLLGGWAFGAVFMATDPVSSPFTLRGQLAYGLAIGCLAVLIRAVNPAYPEGMMLAILFMNLFAPVIDHVVVQANVKRRLARDRS